MIEFTASGFIEVWKDAKVVSKHRVEREAIESCARSGAGTYTITYPVVTVVVTGEPAARSTARCTHERHLRRHHDQRVRHRDHGGDSARR